MSRASKVFFTSSLVLTVGTVWGVHYLQKQESENMYQGVVKDEARLKAKAQALLAAALPEAIAPSPPASLAPPPASSTSLAALPSPSTSTSTTTSQAHNLKVLSSAHSSATPLNTPSSPVQQPAPVIDPECVTCVISPPPQLIEAQSPEDRRRDRQLRQLEYEQQKDLGKRLGQEQGVSVSPEGRRMV